MGDQPYTAAELEAGAWALAVYDYNHALSANGEIGPHHRPEVAAVLTAVLPLHAARIRQQVAEDIAQAIEAAPSVALTLGRDIAAGIARAHTTTPTEEPEEPEPPRTPCPEGFYWIGQPLTSCDRCGLPAWEHDGTAVPNTDPPSPRHAPKWVLEPWKPGERDAVRRRWDPNYTATEEEATDASR